jgi:hypothetical protein
MDHIDELSRLDTKYLECPQREFDLSTCNLIEWRKIGVFYGFVDHKYNIAALEKMPQIQEVSLAVVLVESLVFLISNYCVFRVDTQFNIPKMMVRGIDHCCHDLVTWMGQCHHQFEILLVALE